MSRSYCAPFLGSNIDGGQLVMVCRPLQVEFGIGEWVQFKGVEGMTEINGLEVKVRSRNR